MTGIQIKLNRDTPAGPDVETVYFATMRRCPELRTLLRAYVEANIAKAASVRRNELTIEKVSETENFEAVESWRSDSCASALAVEDASYAEAEAMWQFLRKGFAAAGYDDGTAERLASDIPNERIGEVISASRVGAGMMDFSSPSKR
jgi:hypothetical protein